ncbi:MAG TPA: class I SAM-dependent methyltransferase [Nitrososphaerales archaeon]|nr:class I SAM-dependent methyltransferase [Nitrososphaerales archaeon]
MANSSPGPGGDAAQPHRVRLKGVQQTLLITLYAKALDSRSKRPILGDKKADEMVRAIDYDFAGVHRPGNGNAIVVRAKQIDEWVREFLRANPNAVVLNLGCGLDSRVSRVRPSPAVSWFDLDFPGVIEERKNFFSSRDGYQMLESSVTDPAWMESVPGGRPVLVVAEGLFEYLTEEEVRSVLNRTTDRFPRGQVVFDVMNSSAIVSGRSTLKEKMDAEHRWAVDDVRAVDALDSRLRRVSSQSIFTSSYMPTGYRLAFGVASVVPRFRGMIRLLRYEFG